MTCPILSYPIYYSIRYARLVRVREAVNVVWPRFIVVRWRRPRVVAAVVVAVIDRPLLVDAVDVCQQVALSIVEP